MSRVVRKYGGSSLREPGQIRSVARHIAQLRAEGHDVVVVVSAMAATTDEFIALARALHDDPPRREMDMLLSVGERVSCSLLAMALDAEGVPAISYTGSQVGIITDTAHGEAHIVDVRPTRCLEALDRGQVVVVAGFQGVSVQKEITTLGRGGSDATAIALAAAIGAERCELMKDVDGLFSADPNKVPDAVLLESVDYDGALALAQGGSVVLQSEAARLAREHGVPLRIGRSSSDEIGTIVTERPFARPVILGLAQRSGLVQQRGKDDPADATDWVRLLHTDEGWVGWRPAGSGEEATHAAITVVLNRPAGMAEVHRAVGFALHTARILIHGLQASHGELWMAMAEDQAADAQRVLHDLFIEKGWLSPETPREDVVTHGSAEG